MNDREYEIQRKMEQKLKEARKHQGCSSWACHVGTPDECPHKESNPSNPVTNPPDHPLSCPKCRGALDTLEVSYGRGVTDNGIWVTEGGHMHTSVGFTDPMDYDVKTVGAICSDTDCGWEIERPDWFEYLKDYEANEVKRIKEEFEKVKRGEA